MTAVPFENILESAEARPSLRRRVREVLPFLVGILLTAFLMVSLVTAVILASTVTATWSAQSAPEVATFRLSP